MVKKKDPVGGVLFLAGLFLGLAGGALYGNYTIGALIGLAVGFLASAIYQISKKK